MRNIGCLIACLVFTTGNFAQVKNINIITAGAIADGRTNNGPFIQKLIDKISAEGGGRITVPPGNFMTGSLMLKSNIELHIELGGVLLGSHSTNDYKNIDNQTGLLLSDNQQNISITGEGIIDGQGQELMLDIFQKLRSGELKNDSIWLYKRPDAGRSKNIYFFQCNYIV